MTKILRDVFQDPQVAHKYVKHLDKKVQVDSSVSPEPEIIPEPESATDIKTNGNFPEAVRKGS